VYVFHVYVSSVYCTCCNGYTRLLQVYLPNVSLVFIRMLHMLQWLYAYVVKCMFQMFQLFHKYVQVFYLDVACLAVAIHICCTSMFQTFHMFQTYVSSVFISKHGKRT
jgi:hypothetical protein